MRKGEGSLRLLWRMATVFAAAFFLAGSAAGKAKAQETVLESETLDEEAAEQIESGEDKENPLTSVTETESPIDFASLRSLNLDIYSWISIPGIGIDDPVLQSVSSDQEFYLHHDLMGNETVGGSIYSEYYNRRSYTDFLTVLYGHNMEDQSVFGALKLLEDPEVMWDNKTVSIYLPQITLRYEIFAAYPVDDQHLLYQFDQSDDADREAYLKKVEEQGKEAASFDKALFETLTKDSHILALSTCYYDQPERRFLVQAVLDESQWDWDEQAVLLGVSAPEKNAGPEDEPEKDSEENPEGELTEEPEEESTEQPRMFYVPEQDNESETLSDTDATGGKHISELVYLEEESPVNILEPESESESETGIEGESDAETDKMPETVVIVR